MARDRRIGIEATGTEAATVTRSMEIAMGEFRLTRHRAAHLGSRRSEMRPGFVALPSNAAQPADIGDFSNRRLTPITNWVTIRW